MSLLFDFCLHFMTRATEYTLTCNLGFPKTVHTNGIHPFRIFKGAQKLEPPYFFFFFYGGGRGGGGVEGTNRKGGYIPRASGADKLMDSCTYLIQRNLDITNVPV